MTYKTNFDVSPKELRELLVKPSDFFYHGKNDDLFHTWSIGPVVVQRDQNILLTSNVLVLMERLKGYEKDWKILCCSHWGCGWIKHLTFRAREEPADCTSADQRLREIEQSFYELAEEKQLIGLDLYHRQYGEYEQALLEQQTRLLRQKDELQYVPTDVCRIVCEWAHQIRDYNILDEDGLNTLDFEKTCENLQQIARDVRTGVPENWSTLLYDWLAVHHPAQLGSESYNGAWPDSQVVQQGLAALGFLEKDDE